MKKALDIIHEIISIIKTTGKGIQIAGDASASKRIRKAIAENDIAKLQRIVTRGGIVIDEKDILGIFKSDKTPAVLVSPDFIAKYRQMFRAIRRYERSK